MRTYYYEPQRNLKVYYTSYRLPVCNECKKQYDLDQWIRIKKDEKKISDYEIIYTMHCLKLNPKNKIKVNCKKEDCNGIIEFKYRVWVVDYRKAKVKKLHGFSVSEGMQNLERFYCYTLKDRLNLIKELCEKYKKGA